MCAYIENFIIIMRVIIIVKPLYGLTVYWVVDSTKGKRDREGLREAHFRAFGCGKERMSTNIGDIIVCMSVYLYDLIDIIWF